jgi:probable HAF family extracellular repeat protein
LKDLEADHVLARTDYKEVPPRVDYALTPLGRSLADAIVPITFKESSVAIGIGRLGAILAPTISGVRSEAVGSTCTTTPNLHAAKWTWDASGYTLTDLGVLPNALGGPSTGGPSSEAYAFNNLGDIVGGSDTAYFAYTGNFQVAHHAFVYTNGVMTNLGAIAGQDYYSEAESVNDSHEIVGNTQTVSSASGAVLARNCPN